ncbi:conserved hypothetical protein [[Clostridium] ultunense Esp]|uniref:YraN family protein n=1 Tax=Thermicanus aegyptius TaxID=94009 RepID=UPI0002B6F689|nr:YraN family protein [Thermicanus aegyptius]CCQ92332.1 conserved hypothetical protein [[Clostridium] ultunense Esp]
MKEDASYNPAAKKLTRAREKENHLGIEEGERRGVTHRGENEPLRLHKKELGNKAEEDASRYLSKRGYQILHRNYRTRFGEIDLICEREGTLIFVEVRSKRSLAFGTGAESVIRKKREKIRRVAEQYLLSHKLTERRIRFDVIEIHYGREKDEIEAHLRHLEGAF